MQNVVLLTGISGFLGQHVYREFTRTGRLVFGIDLYVADEPETRLSRHTRVEIPSRKFESLLSEIQPELIINCSGRASVGNSIMHPAVDYQGNTLLVFYLLEEIRLRSPDCAFIMLSSAATYGNPDQLPVTEDETCKPISPYGFHKLQAEMLCREFTVVYGIKTAIARIFSAYGPGLRRQVLWDIYRKAISEDMIELKGTGNETRDFIHATDVAHGLQRIAEHSPFHAEVYNLASGTEVSIRDLAYLIIQTMGKNVPIRFNGISDAGNPSKWRADISRIRSLDFTPCIGLEYGVQNYINWCQKYARI